MDIGHAGPEGRQYMTDLQTQAEQRHGLRQEQRERKVTREACRMGWSDVGREAEATYPLDQLGGVGGEENCTEIWWTVACNQHSHMHTRAGGVPGGEAG